MELTANQRLALKNYINSQPALAAQPPDSTGADAIAKVLNAEATPAFYVWSTNADVGAIRAKVTWANLTPADAPDGTQAWANRSLQCQGKQFNLQLILPYAGTIDASDANLRAGLQDALTAIRSGVGGVSQSAGWAGVQGVLTRKARLIEKVLADTSGGQDGSTKALAATMAVEGEIGYDVVQAVRAQ